MGTKMKGLLKGLRYISQIFEGEDKEPEMEIGFPTDVKHVAHIGWDGPSVNNAPSWMTEYKSAPLNGPAGGEGNEIEAPPKFPSAEFQPTGEAPPRPRQSRKDSSSSDPAVRDPSKPSRRRPSSGSVTVDIPAREGSEGSRRGRRTQSTNAGTNGGPDSPSSQTDAPGIPKQSRRRKTKGSNSGGSSRSSRTKSVENGSDDRSVAAGEPSPKSKAEREEEEVCHV